MFIFYFGISHIFFHPRSLNQQLASFCSFCKLFSKVRSQFPQTMLQWTKLDMCIRKMFKGYPLCMQHKMKSFHFNIHLFRFFVNLSKLNRKQWSLCCTGKYDGTRWMWGKTVLITFLTIWTEEGSWRSKTWNDTTNHNLLCLMADSVTQISNAIEEMKCGICFWDYCHLQKYAANYSIISANWIKC